MHMRLHIPRSRRALIALGTLIGSLALVIGITALAAPTTATKTPTSTRAVRGIFPPEVTFPADKQAVFDRVATRRANVAVEFTAHPATPAPIRQVSTPIPKQGIQNYQLQRPYGDEISMQNWWTSGQSDEVLAGVSYTDSQQGLIGVITGDLHRGVPPMDVYQTPEKHGWVRITAVNGFVISLIAADGTMLTFDYKTRIFS